MSGTGVKCTVADGNTSAGAEALLVPLMHPLHWLSALIVAIAMYVGVLLWYRWHYPRQRGAFRRT